MISKLKVRVLFMLLGSVLTIAMILLVGWLQSRTPVAIASTSVQLTACRIATTNFFSMAGRWPTSATELVTNSMGVVFIEPEQMARDGWGRQIVYEPYATNAGYGRDGRPGGAGADADLEQRFP